MKVHQVVSKTGPDRIKVRDA